jgi:hypothetical protein
MTLPCRCSSATHSASSSTTTTSKKKKNCATNKKMGIILDSVSDRSKIRLKSSFILMKNSDKKNLSSFMKKLKESSSSSSSSSASSPLKSYRFETRKNFSSTARKIFHDFLKNHLNNPYPNEQEKNDMARESNCTVEQVGTWFVNARVRTLPKLLGLKKQKIKR